MGTPGQLIQWLAMFEDNKRATVLYGGTGADVTLDLVGLPESFDTEVDVEVRKATLSGAEGVSGTPPVILALNGVQVSAGKLELTVPTYDRYAGYQVIITPKQDRTLAADAVWSTSIEAEMTALAGARVYTQDPAGGGGWRFLASGGRDVGSFSQVNSQSAWEVTVPRDGTYRYQVIGATPGTPGRHALFIDGEVYAHAWDSGYYDVALDYRTATAAEVGIAVNGRAVAMASAPGAGSWSSTSRLHLAEGINEIEIRSNEGILLKDVVTTRASEGDGAAVTIEAESGSMHGAAVVESIGAATGTNVSGGGIAGYLGNGAGNYVEIPRQPGFDTPGDYDIVVSYANAELSGRHDYNPQVVDRRLQVREADSATVVGSAHFRYTYSWNSFLDRTIPVTLTTADGALQLGNDGAFAPNVDKITVAPVAVGAPITVANQEADSSIELTLSPAAPDGNGGWYVSPVTVIATSTATTPPALEYSINDAAWLPYTSNVSLSEDGTHTFAIRVGPTRAVTVPEVATIRLDQTAPTVAATINTSPAQVADVGGLPTTPGENPGGIAVTGAHIGSLAAIAAILGGAGAWLWLRRKSRRGEGELN